MIDDVGQILAEAVQQFVARHAALRRQRVDLIGAERAGEIAGGDLLVRTIADPGTRGVAVALLLELVQEVAEAAAEHAARRATCEQAAQSALENIAETSAAHTTR